MKEKPESIEPNTLKSEHLREGVSPIMACIGTHAEFKDDLSFASENKSKWCGVNFDASVPYLNTNHFKNDGYKTYVISPINELDKFSEKFFSCLGVVATGVDKETRENISLLSHQYPSSFMHESKESFTSDFEESLEELKTRSEDGTLDAVIVGGNQIATIKSDPENVRKLEYIDPVKFLSSEIRKILGFEPVVMTGPKLNRYFENIFYDTHGRRLYILRPEGNSPTNNSFLVSDIESEKKEWK